MTSLFSMGRRYLLVGVACGLGLFAVQGREACAGPLTLTVTETGGSALDITDGGSLDTDGVVNGIINVNYQLLNLSLVNYQFSGLTATSNALTSGNPAFLKQTGTLNLATGGSGSISIVATDNGYNQPPAGSGTLNSSATALYTQAPTGTQSFTSWFNPSNTLNGQETASPTVTLLAASPPNPNSHSGDAGPTSLGTLGSPYGLTNSSTFTLTGGTSSVPSQVQFTGSTTVTAIPEPASLALMLSAVPVTLFGALRRRKAAK